MPKFNDRFAGLFGGSNPKEIISEAEEIVVPSDLDIFDEQLNRDATRTTINDRYAWNNWEELKSKTRDQTGRFEGRSMDAVEELYPEEVLDARNKQFTEWDNDFERQRYRWRTDPVLKDLPQNPNYHRLKDEWGYRGKIAPDDLSLLDEELGSIKAPYNVPTSFEVDGDQKYWNDMAEQWGDTKRREIAETMDSTDPRVYEINQDAKRRERNMKKFIETMDAPSSTVSTKRNLETLPESDIDRRARILENKLNPKKPVRSLNEIRDSLDDMSRNLGIPITDTDYEGPHRFYKDQTSAQKMASLREAARQNSMRASMLLDELDQLDTPRASTSRTPRTPVINTPEIPEIDIPRTPVVDIPRTYRLGKLPSGVKTAGAGFIVDALLGGLTEYATNPDVNELEALYSGVTSVIPESGGTAPGTFITIDDKNYTETSTPGKYLSTDGTAQEYGIEYLNGKPQMVRYGQGQAGMARLDQMIEPVAAQVKSTMKKRLGVPEPKGRQLVLAVLNNEEGEMIPGDPTSFRRKNWTEEERMRFYRR